MRIFWYPFVNFQPLQYPNFFQVVWKNVESGAPSLFSFIENLSFTYRLHNLFTSLLCYPHISLILIIKFQIKFPSTFSSNEIRENERTKFVHFRFKFSPISMYFRRNFRPHFRNEFREFRENFERKFGNPSFKKNKK